MLLKPLACCLLFATACLAQTHPTLLGMSHHTAGPVQFTITESSVPDAFTGGTFEKVQDMK